MSDAPSFGSTSTVRGGYDHWASVYDRDANPLLALEEPFVRDAIGAVGGLSVLDLGCGTGRHVLWLASVGADVTAVDFSEGMLAEARRVLKSGGRAVVSAMHPAMFLRGTQARFIDPESGEVVRPGSLPHPFGDFVMAALRAGFRLEHIGEHAPDLAFAARYPRAEKYVGWPMLVVMGLAALEAE